MAGDVGCGTMRNILYFTLISSSYLSKMDIFGVDDGFLPDILEEGIRHLERLEHELADGHLLRSVVAMRYSIGHGDEG